MKSDVERHNVTRRIADSMRKGHVMGAEETTQRLLDEVVAYQMSLPETQEKLRQELENYVLWGNTLGNWRSFLSEPLNGD